MESKLEKFLKDARYYFPEDEHRWKELEEERAMLQRELQEYKDALALEQRYAANVAIRRAFDPELDR